jgi:hypothetical protein
MPGNIKGESGDIIPSNKSPQTPQAASMNYPHSEPEHAAKRLIPEKGPTKTNGKLGKGF